MRQSVTFPAPGRYHVLVDVYPVLPETPQLVNFQLTETATVRGAAKAVPLPAYRPEVTVGGYHVQIEKTPKITALEPAFVTIRIRDADGRPPQLELYYGALAHAIFFRAGSLAYFHTHICAPSAPGCASLVGGAALRGSGTSSGLLHVGILLPAGGDLAALPAVQGAGADPDRTVYVAGAVMRQIRSRRLGGGRRGGRARRAHARVRARARIPAPRRSDGVTGGPRPVVVARDRRRARRRSSRAPCSWLSRSACASATGCGRPEPPRGCGSSRCSCARRVLLVVASLAFAAVETTIHVREGLGFHGLHCLTGPVHENALPLIGALSLVAAAIVEAVRHARRVRAPRRRGAPARRRVPRAPRAALLASARAGLARRSRPVAAAAGRGPPVSSFR